MKFNVALLIGFTMLTSNCLNSPRSESKLERKDQPVLFSGLLTPPASEVALQTYDFHHRRWVTFAAAYVDATEPVSDSNGRSWYRFTSEVILPQHADFWTAEGARGPLKAKVRAMQRNQPLFTFDTRAEDCVRKAQLANYSEDETLNACKSPTSPVAELLLTSCGNKDESCCDYYGAQEKELCHQTWVCEQGICRQPAYPVPIVPDYQVNISIPKGYGLRDAWIVLDDKSVGRDTEIPIYSRHRPKPGVQRTKPHPDVARMTFDLPLWKPGINRFRIRAHLVKSRKIKQIETPYTELVYQIPKTLGHIEKGKFRLPTLHFPIRVKDCNSLFCKDADGDGLNDLWENVALHQLRPRLMMDSQDELFNPKHGSDTVRVLTSVYPLHRNGEQYILFANVIAFSRDYGAPSLSGYGHPGDTEAWGMIMKVTSDETLHWTASVAKGHDCLICSPDWMWYYQDFAPDGVPLVYVEEDKHGLWQSGKQCKKESAFDCHGNRILRPYAVNIGDGGRPAPRPLVDMLDDLADHGPHGELAGIFPGEAVWTSKRARVFGRFCGGIPMGCTHKKSATIPGAVIESLIEKFESSGWNP